MSGEVPGQVAARSFAIFWRLAISGKARQRNSQKIELSGGFKMLFYLCTAVLRSTNSALQVCMEKNVKFKHKFCINLWFFLLKKGRCVVVLLSYCSTQLQYYIVQETKLRVLAMQCSNILLDPINQKQSDKTDYKRLCKSL